MSRVDNYGLMRDLTQSQVSLPISMLGVPGDGVVNIGKLFQFVSNELNEADNKKADLENKVAEMDGKRNNLANVIKLIVESQGGEVTTSIPTPENTEGKELLMKDDGRETLVLALKEKK